MSGYCLLHLYLFFFFAISPAPSLARCHHTDAALLLSTFPPTTVGCHHQPYLAPSRYPSPSYFWTTHWRMPTDGTPTTHAPINNNIIQHLVQLVRSIFFSPLFHFCLIVSVASSLAFSLSRLHPFPATTTTQPHRPPPFTPPTPSHNHTHCIAGGISYMCCCAASNQRLHQIAFW